MECLFCTKKFETKESLIEHTKDQHSELVFQCDVCNELLNRNLLIEHMTAHAKEYKRCMTNKDQTDDQADDKDYGIECTNCMELISTQEDLDAHSAKSCVAGADYDEVIDKTIIQEVAINFPFSNTKCYICNKTFSNRSGVRYHLNQVHAKIKDFQCDICQKSFGAKSILENHISGIHAGGEKNFICAKCDKSFKTKSNLYVHMKSHSSNYSFMCGICDKSYKFHHHLKQHHLTVHSNDTFECELCNKSFPSNLNLILHMRTHLTGREYTCEKCNIVYKQKRYYQVHYKKTHGKDEEESE